MNSRVFPMNGASTLSPTLESGRDQRLVLDMLNRQGEALEGVI